MDIVTLGAALNGSAEYVNSHFRGGSNIQIVDNPDGTQTINASGEVSSEDTVARAEIAEMKDGTDIDSFGDVETALDDKADTLTTYTKTEVDTALSAKANSADVYSKTAVDTALSNKADKSTTYTKTEVDTSLSNKADKSTTYTKTEVDTALGGKVDNETGKGLSTNDYTTAEKTKLAGIAEGAEVNVQSNWTQTTTTADDYIKNKPTLGTAAAKNATDTYNATGTDVTTGKAVAAALATLPEPMVFKGSLGTGGTITTLPTASNTNKGYVYKVITAGTYASQSAKVGDTFISDGSAWVLIPSGDEPSGTVTNVAVANGGGLTVSGSPVTSSGTITVGHSNSVTAESSSSVKKFTYDEYGHVTGSSELSTAESDALASGIDSIKVEQIETNKNNILLLEQANGAKNQINIPNGTYTAGTSSFSVTNGAVTSTATDNTTHVTTLVTWTLKAGTYVFYDDSSDVSAVQYRIYQQSPDTRLTPAGQNPATFTLANDTVVYLSCYTFKTGTMTTHPMLVPKTIWDAGFTDYQPYALPNTTITPALVECVDNGAKNRLPATSTTTSTNNGLNLVVNSDYSITITGTMTTVENTDIYFLGSWTNTSPFANYTGKNMRIYCKSSASINGHFKFFNRTASRGYAVAFNNNEGVNISGDLTAAYFTIAATADAINVTLYPMICEPSSYIVSQQYIPPAMSNAELTAAILAIQAQLANQ